MSINRTFFFDQVRGSLFGGTLSQSQTDGMTGILDEWERSFWNLDSRWLAYPFATTYHETDKAMQPIREYGNNAYFIHKYWNNVKVRNQLGNTVIEDAYLRSGRGDVQLTGRANDERATKEIRDQCPQLVTDFEARTGQTFDLIANPKQALDSQIAVAVLFLGMIQGWFTTKKLSDYFNGQTKDDPVNARRIINGLDKSQIIADHYTKFYSAISFIAT